MDEATAKLLNEIRNSRALNRGLYAALEDDKTMDIVARFYAYNPEGAKEWHRLVLPNDLKVAEATAELCGWKLNWEIIKP